MGKQGPCCHCGITTTPLWRNGPPEKPVLCNACGSRWRTKGTLVNYIPTHATQLPKDLTNSDEFEFKPSKPIVRFKNLNPSYNNNNEEKNKKKTKNEDSFGTFRKVLEDSTAASTSSVSCSDSKTDLTEMWVSLVPSKKRTYVSRPTKPSHVEQLTQDLHSLLHQEKINNNNNNSSKILDDYNDDLVYKKRDTLDEFGYGSVLIRTDNIVESEKLQGLKGRDSPLASVKLQDFINYESFVKNMNLAEQENLFKYLPSIDTNNPPDSLNRMFSSKPFMDELSHFKMLLREGVFALSISGANGEDCKILNSLVLDNLTRSEWVEFHQQIKDKMAGGSSSDISNKRPRDISNYTELKGEKRSPKRVRKTPEENNHPRFFKKQGGSCLIAVPLQYSQEDYSEHDLLMDVPRNAPSPEAELLYNGPLKVKSLENSSSVLVDSEIIGEKFVN